MERAQPRNANTDSSTIDKNRMVLDIHSIINSMKDLSGTVSHDLNNFLMGLYGNFELIQNTPLDRHPVYIERIELLLNSLQDFSSSMSKYASKTPTPHLLDLSVTEITEDIISQNPEFKGIQIEKQAECIFKGNPSHITEALTTVLYRFALNDSTIQFATVLPNNIEWILKTTEYSFALCIPIDQQSKQTIESLLIYSVPRLQHQKGLTPLQLIHTFSIIASFNGGIGFSNKYLYLSFPSQVEQSPTKHSKSIID
jgi:hypothetical protein